MRATVHGFSSATDPLDHVIGGELLEIGSMTLDLSRERLALAIDRGG